MTYDINDINLEVDINVSLPLGTMLALFDGVKSMRLCRRHFVQLLDAGD
jgi:hypothetical protein